MRKEDILFSKIDVIIIKELLEIKVKNFTLNTTELCKQLGKQHKIIKPHLDHLESMHLIERNQNGTAKQVKLVKTPETLAFFKSLVQLYDLVDYQN